MFFDILADGGHRRQIMRHERRQHREVLLNIAYERRAARAGQKAFFGKLFGFGRRNHICAERGFCDGVETEKLQSRYDLPQFCIGELAGDGRRDDCVNLIFLVVFAFLDVFYDVQNKRLVRYCAERALINARAAGNALVVVDGGFHIRPHGNGLDFAGLFARTAIVPYCAVRTNLRACAAFLALVFVDVGNVVLIEAYGPEFAHVLASVSQTAAAGVGNLVSAHRTFVAGDVDNFDYVRVFLVAAHGDFYPFDNDCAFLINAATHRRDFPGDDDFRNVRNGFQKLVLPSGPCDLSQDLVLQMLNFRVEFSHFITYIEPSKRRFFA